MTDEDLYYEIPGETPTASEVPDAVAPPAPPPEAPAARPPPPSARPQRTPEEQRRRRRLMIALAAIGVVIVVAIVAVLSFSVSIGPSTANATYPYTVTYDVLFPNAEPVQIGNITIVAIPSPDGNRVTLSVDKVSYDIGLNETREVSAKHATVSLLGISLLSFDFTLEVKYLGLEGQDAHFNLGVRTSEQIPKFMIDRLLPAKVRARPV
ncbi:MAG: hypothetical protein ABFC89_03145 [Methanospirillum sp.]